MLFLIAACLLALSCPAGAAVKLPAIFSDHMVLQCDRPVPVWGTAAPGGNVTVKFRGQEKRTTADGAGKWSVKLDPLKTGGPDTLTVNEVTFADVLVGEVWVGSGQSNMDWRVRNFHRLDPILDGLASNTHSRIRLSIDGSGWSVADPGTVEHFSALLFAFGVRLHEALNVPVGLMAGAIGATPSGHWLTDEMLQADAAAQAELAKALAIYNAGHAQQEQKQYAEALAAWEAAAKIAAEKKQRVPKKPEPPSPFGTTRGHGGCYAKHIAPMLGYGIRGVLWDQGEGGSGIPGLDQYHTMGALIAGWRRAWGQDQFPWLYVQKPSGGGCAWDPANPVNQGAVPFAKVPPAAPGDFHEGFEDYLRILNYPNTAMVQCGDLAPGKHPPCKSGYGARAVTVALAVVYGRQTEYYGPRYASHVVEDGGRIRIKFTHIGQGLAYRHGDKLQGFAVAGADKVFHWADAVVEGDTVVVASAKVSRPKAVRYGTARQPAWANLFNKDGLPALSFRTDAW